MESGENRELLEHVIINDNGVGVPTQPHTIINSELLQSQHGLVVDIAGGEFIPVNYISEDLLSQDLTEEDRNLAAALVAVQLSQQQKHQQLQETVIQSATLPKIVDEQPNNGYLHIVGTDNIYVEKTLPKEEKRDSDVDSLRTSKKSLPHKKRISRKLKKPCVQPNNKKITCNLCEQTFSTSDEFHQHEILCQTTITPVNPMSFNCQICNAPFTDQLKFFEHLKRHYEPPSKGSATPEEKKNEAADAEKEVQPQQQQETPQPPAAAAAAERSESVLSSLLCLTCIECNKTFRRQKTFEQHMRDVHSPKDEGVKDEFSEPEDFMEGINVVVNDNDAASEFEEEPEDESKAWYREEELHQTEEDLKELEESNGHVCHLCKQPFPLRAILLQHLVTCRVLNADLAPANPPPTPKKKGGGGGKKKGCLQCTECDRTFIHRNSLVYHMRSHTGIRPHQCDQCGKSFFASSALKVHLRLHSGDKPYKCTECEKRFRQWGDLKYHMTSIHSNEKNFQCEYCGKEFSRKYSLIVHRRIHTGEKNYKCEFCGKTFRASSYLQNHRRIHTGEKPHSCEICMKPFRVRSDMKRHMKTHQKLPTRLPHSHIVTHTHSPDTKIEQVDDEDEEDTAELHIGDEDEQHILAEYDANTLDPTPTRELTTVRMSNRNLYINGNELFLVTYPSEMPQ